MSKGTAHAEMHPIRGAALTMVVPPLAMHLHALILGRRWSRSFERALANTERSFDPRTGSHR